MENATEQISQYPAPPSFYKLYQDGPTSGPPPPPIPQETELTVLYTPFNINEPLVPPFDMPMLFKAQADGSIDIKTELLKLNKGLLFVFLELLAVLVEQPTEFATMVTAVITNLQNMQHLINMLRPDQARHTLEYILQTQIRQKREALKQLKQQTSSIQQKLVQISQQLATASGDSAESAPQKQHGGTPADGVAPMETS